MKHRNSYSSLGGGRGHRRAIIHRIHHPELHAGRRIRLDDGLQLLPVRLQALGIGEDQDHGAGIPFAEQFMGKPFMIIEAEIWKRQQRRPWRTVQTIEPPRLGPVLWIHPFVVSRNGPQMQQRTPFTAIQVFGPLKNAHRIGISRERHPELGRRTKSIEHRQHRVGKERGGTERQT